MGKNSATAVKTYEQHPLALQLVPGTMPDEEFDAFCADLKKRGQRHPIIMFEDKILDGWHRYRGCKKEGLTPVMEEYKGDDPAGLVIALNVLRRKLGSTQRALAGARLNMDYNITQDEASKRVGVSKVHINLVAQALKSKNARVIKLLENPNLTREQLHEELVDSAIVRPSGPVAASTVSGAGAAVGLDALFGAAPEGPDDDLLGGGDNDTPELDDVLGDPPSAGGKVLSTKPTTPGGMPLVGAKPGHPERRPKETPASLLADKFKGLTEGDKISFIQLTWHMQVKLLSVAGVPLPGAQDPAAVAAGAVAKAAASSATGKAPQAPAKGKAGKGAQAPATATAGAGSTPARARARKAA